MAGSSQILILGDFWVEGLIGGNFHRLVDQVEMAGFSQILILGDFWEEKLIHGNFHRLVDQVEMTSSLQISILVDFWVKELIRGNFHRLVDQVEIISLFIWRIKASERTYLHRQCAQKCKVNWNASPRWNQSIHFNTNWRLLATLWGATKSSPLTGKPHTTGYHIAVNKTTFEASRTRKMR